MPPEVTILIILDCLTFADFITNYMDIFKRKSNSDLGFESLVLLKYFRYKEIGKEIITLNPYFEAKSEQNRLKNSNFASGASDANYFEPLLDCIIIEFNKLMKVYQALEENNDIDIQ